MKRINYLLLLWLIALGVQAQEIKFTAKAPSNVSIGENFQVQYIITNDNPSAFRGPSFDESAFELLAGPYTSSFSSYQYVNGKASSTSTVTYTYTLSAAKKGKFTIPSATVNAGGKRFVSNRLTIQVSEGGGNSHSNAGQSQRTAANSRMQDATGTPISGKDLFITTTASKTHVYEQEAFLLTYKVYTRVNLTQLDPKMPDLKGFHVQQIDLPQTKTFTQERHNGQIYNTVVWSQYVLFPQQTGNLTIPSISFEGIVAQRNSSLDPFDAFFNSGSAYTEVKKRITTPAIQIKVDALPTNKPTGFSGGVGKFSIQSALSPNEIKSGEALTLRVTINGIGNMKLLKTPVVSAPKDFEAYDPKVTDHTQLTKNGIEGSKVIEYVFVPRHPGKYTLPAVSFIYFDLESNKYKTIQTEAYELNVAKGKANNNGNFSSFNKEEVDVLNNDIYYIKKGDATLKASDSDTFFGSLFYQLCYIVPFVLFMVFVYIFRKQAIANANVTLTRVKKANKVARKCMQQAKKQMNNNKREAFYDEVMRALYGYVSDKLSMPIEKLNKENIREKLSSLHLDDNLIDEFIKTLNDCEFARFAPSGKNKEMPDFYEAVISTIEKVDNAIK